MGAAPEVEPPGSLRAAFGANRARVLACVATGATTSQIAGRLGSSPASASEHASVLRGAGLVTSRRLGPAVLHTLTPLGRRCSAGRLDRQAAACL
jgi:DNA-binding transcriptional ArsR family regulator